MIDRQLLKIEGSWRAFTECAIFSMLRAACIISQAVSLSLAICGLWDGRLLSEVGAYLAIFATSFAIREILVFAQERIIDAYSQTVAMKLDERLLECAFDCGDAIIAEYGTPAIVSLLVEGGDNVSRYMRIALPKYADCAIIPICLLVAIFVQDAISGIITLICLPFIFVFLRLIGMGARYEADIRHAQFEQLSNSFVDISRGIFELKAFGTDGLFAKIIYDGSEAFRRITMKTLRISMLSSAVLDLFATLALAGVAIMLGFRMVDGDVAFFPALCILVLVPECFKPIREFGRNYHETLDGSASLKAFLDFFRRADACMTREPAFWPRDICANDTFDIRTSDKATYAITGPNGSGKTTFLNALAGITNPPEDFAFSIDSIEMGTLNDDDWKGRVAYIPQNPHIFNASIRENVALYSPDASEGDIRTALDALSLTELVDELPEGLDTLIGEAGRDLSGGQAQRIALCRALLAKNRDVILMDEPTSHVDADTERLLMDAISKLAKDKTLFIVTHNPEWAHILDSEIPLGKAGIS